MSRKTTHLVRATAAEARGDRQQAHSFAREAFGMRGSLGRRHGTVKWSYPIAVDTAIQLGDLAFAEELVSTVEGWKPGETSPFMHAMAMRFRARLAPDTPEADGRFKSATGLFREIGAPFYQACTMLEHAEWLTAPVAGAARRGGAEPRETVRAGAGIRTPDLPLTRRLLYH